MSVDPYMRGRMNEGKSYVPPFELGKPLDGGAVGEVVESRTVEFKQGDSVVSNLSWRRRMVSMFITIMSEAKRSKQRSRFCGCMVGSSPVVPFLIVIGTVAGLLSFFCTFQRKSNVSVFSNVSIHPRKTGNL